MKNTTTTLKSENTVLQALAKGACPICALVRAYQNETIENFKSSGIDSVCNYHAWALAASAPAAEVANLFLRILEHRPSVEGNGRDAKPECDFCALLRQHEHLRLQEFAREMRRIPFRDWIEKHGTVCHVHAQTLMKMVPEEDISLVASIIAHNEDDFKEALLDCKTRISEGRQIVGGILGKVAEFLVAQRGLAR